MKRGNRSYHESEALKRRAIDALAAMWRPPGRSELNQHVIEMLKRFIHTSGERDLRLHALHRLAACGGATRDREEPRERRSRSS